MIQSLKEISVIQGWFKTRTLLALLNLYIFTFYEVVSTVLLNGTLPERKLETEGNLPILVIILICKLMSRNLIIIL